MCGATSLTCSLASRARRTTMLGSGTSRGGGGTEGFRAFAVGLYLVKACC